jgi:hypothetical protein
MWTPIPAALSTPLEVWPFKRRTLSQSGDEANWGYGIATFGLPVDRVLES